MQVAETDLREVGNLWRELSRFPAGRYDDALRHALRRLEEIIGGTNAFWVGAAREKTFTSTDIMLGWQPRSVITLHQDPAQEQLAAEQTRRFKANKVDPMTQALVRSAGTTRAFLRQELVDDATWEKSWLVRHALGPRGVTSRLVGVHTINPTTESYIGLDRKMNESPFGPRDRDLLRVFLEGGAELHRHLAMARIRPEPMLTSEEHDILCLLLMDRSDSAIALDLSLTTGRVRESVGCILGKYHVRSRRSLMALWLHPLNVA